MDEIQKLNYPPVKEFTDAFAKILESGEDADMIIKCGDWEKKAHNIIVGNRSDFFHKAITSGFKESQTRVIELGEDNSVNILRLLSYLYTFRYCDERFADDASPNHKGEPSFVSILDCNVRMYVLADKYGVGGLKKIAEQYFEAAFYKLPSLVDKCAGLMAVLHTIYNTTLESDRGLRDLVVSLATQGSDFYTALCSSEQSRPTAVAVPQFVTELLVKTAPGVTLKPCPKCKMTIVAKPESVSCRTCMRNI